MVFELFQKLHQQIYAGQFTIHDIINHSTSICSFEARTYGKEEEKLQKFEYLENKESFFGEISFKLIWDTCRGLM